MTLDGSLHICVNLAGLSRLRLLRLGLFTHQKFIQTDIEEFCNPNQLVGFRHCLIPLPLADCLTGHLQFLCQHILRHPGPATKRL